jgi:hypothetical protein
MLSAMLAGPGGATPASAGPASTPTPGQSAAISQALDGTGLRFEPNEGQAGPAPGYVARGAGFTVAAGPTEAVLRQGPADATSVQFVGANPQAVAMPEQPLAGQVSYFLGGRPGAPTEITVPTFGRVQYQNVYPGINLVYYSTQGQLEYDFVLQPGADPRAIALNVQGARSVAVDAGGDLVMQTASGVVRQRQPVVYQDQGGGRQQVAGGYVLDGGQVHFRLGAYDAGRPLVIDPFLLVFSTYYGNPLTLGASTLNAVKSAFGGSVVYVVGYTAGFFGWSNLLVARLDMDLATNTVTSLVPYIMGGTTGDSTGRGVAVDLANANRLFVAGDTGASDFPVTPESTFFPGQHSAVLISLTTGDGGGLNWSEATQGDGLDQGLGVAAAPPLANGGSGGAYFALRIDQTFQTGTYNASVVRLYSDGTAGVAYLTDPLTILGFSSAWSGIDVMPNPAPGLNDGPNTVVLTGWVFDASVPGTHPFLARLNDNINGRTMNVDPVFRPFFVPQFGSGTRLAIDPTVLDPTDPTGQLPTFVVTGNVANELGGSDLWLARYGLSGFFLQGEFWRFGSFNTGSDIALGGGGSIGVVGSSNVTGSLQAGFFAFDQLLTPTDSFNFTGSGASTGYGIALGDARVYIVGATSSPDFPVVNPIQPFLAGPVDGFVAELTL